MSIGPSEADEEEREQAPRYMHHETVREFVEAYPWVDETAIEIAFSVQAIYLAAMNAARVLTQSLGLGRTIARISVLRALTLTANGALSQKAIAEKLMMSRTTITNLVDGLERDGLVVRSTSGEDRRITMVELTESGREVSGRLLPAVAELHKQFCAGFTEEEKRTLADLMFRFWENASILGSTKGASLDGSSF